MDDMATRRPKIRPADAAGDWEVLADAASRVGQVFDVEDATGLDLSLYGAAGENCGAIAMFSTQPDGRRVITGLLLLGQSVSSETLRAVPMALIEHQGNAGGYASEQVDDLPPLERNGLTSDGFSQLVARHYLAWARQVSNPAASISAKTGAKPATVHSWIREARLRKYLPPARTRRPRNG